MIKCYGLEELWEKAMKREQLSKAGADDLSSDEKRARRSENIHPRSGGNEDGQAWEDPLQIMKVYAVPNTATG